MRIAIDATSAAVQRAGVGRYTRELLRALLELPDDDSYELLCAASMSEVSALLDELPPGNERVARRLPVSQRAVTIGWQRLRLPLPVETLLGPFDVFHGPDFVLPPSRRPRVVTIHDLSFRITPQYAEPRLVEYLNAAVPRALQSADRIIAVSAAVAAEIVAEYPFARERVVAIPNGVRAEVAVTHMRSDNRPVVLFLGTIEPRKGIDTLIEAVRRTRSTYPELRLVIAGRIGWRANALVSEIRAAERDGFATFLEAPDDGEMAEAFRDATIFAYPSRYEGFGLPILEAMAHGVPVVTSDIPVLRETGGDAATYVRPDDPDDLGAAIVALLADAELRETLVTRGRQRVAGYSWRQTAVSTRCVYAAAANRDGR